MKKQAKKVVKKSVKKAPATTTYSNNTKSLVALALLALAFMEFWMLTKFFEQVLRQNTFQLFMILFVAQVGLIFYLLHLVSKK